jgi:hypothetical protein
MSENEVIVYKDWKMIITTWLLIISLPAFGIKAYLDEGSPLFFIGGSILLSIIIFFYNKYLRGGIILDLKSRFISFPKVSLFAFFKPYPRNDISFDDITGIQAINETEVQGNTAATLKFIKKYKFVIHGSFGSKTVSFNNLEKREQFYSLLASYGNFS